MVPGIFVGDEAPSSSADHGHSLGSLASAAGGGRLAPQLRYTWIELYSMPFGAISQGESKEEIMKKFPGLDERDL